MAIRLWQKRDVNTFCKKLTDAGYHPSGDDYKIQCWHEGDLVFSAMRGHRNWLCRINDKYIDQQDASVPVLV